LNGLLRFARNDGLERAIPQPSSPANGSAEWPPDDRLRRAIQYSEAPVIESRSRGVLDAPHARGMTVIAKRSVTYPRETHPSCPDLIRASINLRNKLFSKKMDHRVKPGDDEFRAGKEAGHTIVPRPAGVPPLRKT
jgi:hypothetical protein